MPKIAEIKEIDGKIWVRVDMDLPSPITLWTDEERSAELLAERLSATERAAKIAEEFGKPYALHTATGAMMFRASAEKIAAAIRSQP